MKIKQMPKLMQPREKMIRYGVERLTNEELLAIIIGSGTRKHNAVDLANKLMRNISSLQLKEIRKGEGIGISKMCTILAAIELGKRISQKNSVSILSPQDVWNILVDIRASNKEYFVVFYLDVQNQVIKKETISIGSLNASIVHPREVFEPAIKNSAAQILVSHNHPSGMNKPSQEDIELTKRLFAAGELLGIALADHVIVTKEGYYSFKEKKLL